MRRVRPAMEPPRVLRRVAVCFPRVVVMAKVPELGRVKTRLGRQIGSVEATRVFRATSHAMLGRISRDPRFQIVLALSPDAALKSRSFDGRLSRMGQGRGDLGARMTHVANRAPLGPVIIVGTDIPSITGDRLARAFKKLSGNDVVIGPADDGGFWLIGFRRRPALDCFQNVRWSHAETLADVLSNLSHRRVALADTLSDIDSAADVRRLSHHIGRRVI